MYQQILTEQEPFNLNIKSMANATNFVYVWINKSIWKELQYSIQSVQKFYKGPYKIFIIGDNPKLRGVKHIYVKRYIPKNPEDIYYRSIDAHIKLNIIANTKEINEEFIYMYDDTFLLRNLTRNDFVRYSHGEIDFEWMTKKRHGAQYKKLMQTTLDLLTMNESTLYNYDTHLPHVFHKSKIRKLIKKFNLLDTYALFNTLYHNYFYEKPDYILGEEQKILALIPEPTRITGLLTRIKGRKFLNYNNNALNSVLQQFIKDHIAGKKYKNKFGY